MLSGDSGQWVASVSPDGWVTSASLSLFICGMESIEPSSQGHREHSEIMYQHSACFTVACLLFTIPASSFLLGADRHGSLVSSLIHPPPGPLLQLQAGQEASEVTQSL